jgi:hypothetical protein
MEGKVICKLQGTIYNLLFQLTDIKICDYTILVSSRENICRYQFRKLRKHKLMDMKYI